MGESERRSSVVTKLDLSAADEVEYHKDVRPTSPTSERGGSLERRNFGKLSTRLRSFRRSIGTVDERRRSTQTSARRFTETLSNTIFKDDKTVMVEGAQASFISAYTTPGPRERTISETKKANLGVMLGVYLPTIQHILGVTMFIRLFWVVGIAGLWHTLLLLLLCCSCTLLTSISLSAVATNGVVEGGGAYFMISRNLGVEFGSAVGILFYLANTVAASMYLVGGVEVMLLYIFPSLTIGGDEVHSETGMWGMMSNNFRIYGSAFLLLEVIIVAMGVRFVQLLAPVSLMCVILSILACFAGGIEKAIRHNGQHVCMLNDQLLRSRIYFPHGGDLSQICTLCVKSEGLSDDFCNSTSAAFCSHFTAGTLSCVNAFPGINTKTLSENMQPRYMEAGESYPGVAVEDSALEVSQDFRTSFFILLAIYFPAVTGIMTGTNMSGDLKDPQRSIPCGTIAATLTTSAIYYALAFVFAASISGPVLRDKYGRSIDSSMIVASLSWPSPWVVIIGSFLSTFGAALQCLCSAPRLLQSIAKDDVIPALSPFAKVTSRNEPFVGLLFTAFIAEFAILLGAVDAIAEVLDFFFLMCYAFVNLICALHSLLGAPNWRPRFKYYHWSLSVMGALLCFFIMFASQWHYALAAIFLTMVIYKYVEWKGAKKEWGDGIRGLALSTAQYSLLQVEDKDPHPKNWRPQLLLLMDGLWSKDVIDMRCVNMLNLAGQLKAGRGLAIVVAFIRGSCANEVDRNKSEEAKKIIQRYMSDARLRGFAKALIFDEQQIEGCVSTLYQSIGIGGLRPNTVMLNWPKMKENNRVFAVRLIGAALNEQCIMVTKGITDFPLHFNRLAGFIDIWWLLKDGGILLLTAFLLRQHKVWRGCELRIFTVADDSSDTNEVKKNLKRYIYMLRIDADVFIVKLADDETTEEDHTKDEQQTDSTGTVKGASNLAYKKDESETKLARRSSLGYNRLTDGNDTNEDIVDENHHSSGHSEKLSIAVRLNQVILEHSSQSQLLLLNLPQPPKKIDQVLNEYIMYVDAVTKSIPRVLLVGGSGKEVITTSS